LYELAHMAVPTIVLAQNDVEMKHTFASLGHGFLHLGLASRVDEVAIRGAFQGLEGSPQLRAAFRERMTQVELTSGREFVIRQLLEKSPR
jgi:hypothetical protein